MARPSLRVIFDRSAFHGDRFDALTKSSLLQLCRRNALKVFHTPVFLEETLTAYGSRQGVKDRQRHLEFALDVCNGGFFLDKDQIWHNELVAGRGPFARYLIPERPSKNYGWRPRLMNTLRQKIASGDLSQEWAETEAMREVTHTKKNNQKAISRAMRNEIAAAIREKRVVGAVKDYTFAQFRRSGFERTGRQLMDLADSRRSVALGDQWAQRPARFPFYSAFVEGLLYTGFYAAVEHNEPLDRSAQEDYEQLAYLTWADIVVSDDQKFFRRAFETLWKPRRKRLETSERFIGLVERLAKSLGSRRRSVNSAPLSMRRRAPRKGR